MSTRPWQHVLDPLSGYLHVAESALNGIDFSPLNFGPTEASLSVNDVVEVAKRAGFIDQNFEINDRETSHFESKRLDLDSSKARSNLNWYPLWTQEEALTATFAWWRNVCELGMHALEACQNDISQLA